MSIEKKAQLLGYAKARYVAGETLDELVESLPVSKATLHRAQVEQGWRRKDLDAQAAGLENAGTPEWLVKYRAELARVPSGVDRALVNQPDRLAELKAQAEALPESLDITDMKQAAQKAGELAARYQLMGEVKLADAQARLAERFVRLALGMARVDGKATIEAEEEVDTRPSLEEMREVIIQRMRRMPAAGPGNEGRTLGDLDDEEEERARAEAARANEGLDGQDLDAGEYGAEAVDVSDEVYGAGEVEDIAGDDGVEAGDISPYSSAEEWEAALERGRQACVRVRQL